MNTYLQANHVTTTSLRAVLAMTLLGFLGPLGLKAQNYMNDGSSVYLDGWTDSSYVYGYGSTSGSLAIHRYRVDVTITSPLGRSMTNTNTYAPGFVSTTASLGWDWNDLGDYMIRSTHKGQCLASGILFVLATQLKTRKPAPQIPPCTGPDTATCAEGNDEAPLGARKDLRCSKSTNCCTRADPQNPIPGFCRKETCYKCTGQAKDPVHSSCHTENVCATPLINAYCMDLSGCR